MKNFNCQERGNVKNLDRDWVGRVLEVIGLRHAQHTGCIGGDCTINVELVLLAQVLESLGVWLPFLPGHGFFQYPVHVRTVARPYDGGLGQLGCLAEIFQRRQSFGQRGVRFGWATIEVQKKRLERDGVGRVSTVILGAVLGHAVESVVALCLQTICLCTQFFDGGCELLAHSCLIVLFLITPTAIVLTVFQR